MFKIRVCLVLLTMNILLISFKTLDNACVCLQAAFTQVIEVIHHVIVCLIREKKVTTTSDRQGYHV